MCLISFTSARLVLLYFSSFTCSIIYIYMHPPLSLFLMNVLITSGISATEIISTNLCANIFTGENSKPVNQSVNLSRRRAHALSPSLSFSISPSLHVMRHAIEQAAQLMQGIPELSFGQRLGGLPSRWTGAEKL